MADGASGNGVVTSGAVATQPLGSLIDRSYRPREPANDDEVWSLNLDQIEPHSGRVHSKCMLSATELGPSTYAFDRGTVLYSKLRPYLNKVVVADDDGVATTELVPLRCDESRLIAPYLAHFLRGPDFLRFATNVVAGAKMPRMVMSEFWKFPVPLPPLPEQRRIAAILDQADALRAKRREALAQLDSLTQSIFSEMFGDPVTNAMGWPTEAIAEIGEVITGNTPSRGRSDYYGDFIEWIKSDNINSPSYYLTTASEGLSESGKRVGRTAPPLSILVTCIAGSPDCIGNSAMADREVAFNQQINAFLPRLVDPHFAYVHMIVAKRLIQEASTSGMKGMVSKSRFEKIRLIVPPLPLQQTFATRIQAVEALKTTHRAALAELDALFASLQHRAFAGTL